MKTLHKKLSLITIILLILINTSNAETIKKTSHQTQLDITITELANKLFASSNIKHNDTQDIAITSFVNLNQLNKTTHLGRALSESFFDELFIRGFSVSDFRGQKTISVNRNGEYYLTRDVRLLKDAISNSFVLVGTYTIIENSVLINTRIMNNESGKIVASAKSYYKTTNCRILENCPKPRRINIASHDNYFTKKIISKPNYDSIKEKVSTPIAYYKQDNNNKIINTKQINEISLIN
ncbi:MAG: FlgO family outer membrane protein [Campylobacterota bacterium]|nr:FlgO family outer membrane protein [Campylobacterota bacterium]